MYYWIIYGILYLISTLLISTFCMQLICKLFKIENGSLKTSIIISIVNILLISVLTFVVIIINYYNISFLSKIYNSSNVDILVIAFLLFVFLLTFIIDFLLLRKYFSLKVVKSFFVYLCYSILSLIFLGLLLTISKNFIAQPFVVDGISMRPTLGNGSNTLVEKLSKQINRNDVVIHSLSSTNIQLIISKYDTEHDLYGNFVGRVVAVPGDKFEYRNNSFFINDKKIGLVPETENFLEDTGITTNSFTSKDYYILGDNSDHSFDSRYFGFVSKNNIVGKIIPESIIWRDKEMTETAKLTEKIKVDESEIVAENNYQNLSEIYNFSNDIKTNENSTSTTFLVVIISTIILFFSILLVLYVFDNKSSNKLLASIVLSVFIGIISAVVNPLGFFGYVVAIIINFIFVKKILGYDFGTTFLFILGVDFLYFIIFFTINNFIK
ncbi:MAG: hypothetical protein ACD_58C00119G0006 [uncultured bacterium]|nr:MAG: hypothetical protein ACD_58C00119G0006 [uncultured bacterium]